MRRPGSSRRGGRGRGQSHAGNLQRRKSHSRTKRREPHGNGASVVVSGRESRPQGEGRQVGPGSSREGRRNADSRHGETGQTGEPCAVKVASTVRRGAVGKGLALDTNTQRRMD